MTFQVIRCAELLSLTFHKMHSCHLLTTRHQIFRYPHSKACHGCCQGGDRCLLVLMNGYCSACRLLRPWTSDAATKHSAVGLWKHQTHRRLHHPMHCRLQRPGLHIHMCPWQLEHSIRELPTDRWINIAPAVYYLMHFACRCS